MSDPTSAGGRDPGEHAIDAAIVQQAAAWMARLWSEDAGEQDRAACARWRAAHPHHELAWRRLQAFDDKLHSVPGGAARQVLREPAVARMSAAPGRSQASSHRSAKHEGPPISRRRAAQLLGLAAMAGGAGYLARGTDAWQIATAGHRTGTGEVRELALPDGTRIVLASASAVDLRFDDMQRLLVLRAGEILVSTASDPAQRPFRVQSRHGTVRALGTRFTLRQDGDHSRVAVFEGAVEVRPASAPGDEVHVAAGQGADFSADHVQPPAPVSESSAAWTRGVLVADGMPLGELVAELTRYRPGLLRCDPAVADLRVNGVFPLRDTDRALRNLELALPVAVVRRTGYWVMVRAAD